MGGFIAATALFATVAWAMRTLHATPEPSGPAGDAAAAGTHRLPDPGPRDRYALAGGTLGRAHVPSWG